jgi:hypothetical protein
MSRSTWRCRNAECAVRHGAALGTMTDLGGLELARDVVAFAIHLDTGRASVRCPACGIPRDFRGTAVYSSRFRPQ